MPKYHAPPAEQLNQRMAAAKLALEDLTPEERAEIDARMFRLRMIDGIGPDLALELVAALAMATGDS